MMADNGRADGCVAGEWQPYYNPAGGWVGGFQVKTRVRSEQVLTMRHLIDEPVHPTHAASAASAASNQRLLRVSSGFIENGTCDDTAKACRREWSCCHSADPYSRFCAKAPRD